MNKYENEEEHGTVGSGFKPAPAGNHIAACVGIAVIGTVEQEFEGHKKRVKMVRLYFELVGSSNPDDEGKPYIVGQDYTYSMGKKANLRKDLESWRGSAFDNTQAEAFNLVKLLNAPCFLNLAIKKSAKGGEYNDVLSITPVPSTVAVPPKVTEEFLFNFNPPFKQAEFELLEEFVQKKIKTSDEYLAIVNGPASAGSGATGTPAQHTAPITANVAAGAPPF